jgi:hypothetical protein
MDTPIRRCVRVEEVADSTGKPATANIARRRRKKPFAAEYKLLAELGLGRNCGEFDPYVVLVDK